MIKRRMFLARVLKAVAMAPVVACTVGDYDSSDEPVAPSGADAGTAAGFAVSNNDSSGHSHSFTIKCSQKGAEGWTYTAGGGHTHEVTLDREQLEAVFSGETVTVQTSDGHPHTWVITRPDSTCV
jgi:hypothetical protein